MVKAVLKSTTNVGMQRFVGKEGQLEIRNDGKFHFRFEQDDDNRYDLSSKIVRQMGDLSHPASKEITFETRNSIYVFEKREKVRESLFDWVRN